MFEKFDAFAKPIDDFRVKTVVGAVTSIISILIMIVLLTSEVYTSMQTTVSDELHVNTTLAQDLKVRFDISFPEVPCNLLAIDAVDEGGFHQKHALFQVYKHRLSKAGGKAPGASVEKVDIHSKQDHAVMNSVQALALSSNTIQDNDRKKQSGCGNCYGAGSPGQCCNTCDDVQAAYDKKGWRFHSADVTQCDERNLLTDSSEKDSEEGGCQIYGSLTLSRSSGHFHISTSKKVLNKENQQFFNIMDFLALTLNQYSITHTINSLTFGDNFPGWVSPLDNQSKVVESLNCMYQYYVKVVPTKYKKLNKQLIECNQYSVTEHLRVLALGSTAGSPGVYFYYDMSPIEAVFTEKKGHNFLIKLFTTLCAFIGGSYTFMGLVAKVAQYLLKRSVYLNK